MPPELNVLGDAHLRDGAGWVGAGTSQVLRWLLVALVLVAIFLMATVGIWMIYRWGVYGTIAGQALNALVVNILLWSSWFLFKRKL